MKPTFIH